jgi:isoleucyl-tRNA synthetase
MQHMSLLIVALEWCISNHGEEDYNVAMKAGVISEKHLPPNPVDEKGCFTSEVRDFAGQHVKVADKAIIKYLKATGRLVVDGQITHSYPFCWRSDTPLIYRAVPSWFVKVPEIIPNMLEEIEKSHWVPSFVKEKRFASWIASARDGMCQEIDFGDTYSAVGE